jgi:hypothetical protein
MNTKHISKKKIIEQLDRIRVLETSFPVFSLDGVVMGRKTHVLLTYTPKEVPIAQEKHALNADQIRELFSNIYDYILNSTAKKGRTNRRAK